MDVSSGKKPRKVAVRKKAPEVIAQPDALPPLTKRQKYAPGGQRVAVWDILPAPYNPRDINPYARGKLLEEVRRGLVNRPTWNTQTRHLVGGHQRISVLSEIEGACPDCLGKASKLSALWKAIHSNAPFDQERYWLDPAATPDDPKSWCTTCHGCGVHPYSLDVDAIDVPLVEEVRLNIVLNNPSLQGDYNADKLTNALHFVIEGSQGNMDLLSTGFEPADLVHLGVLDEQLLGLGQETQAGKKAIDELDEIAQLKESKKNHKEKDRAREASELSAQIVIYGKNEDEIAALMTELGLNPETGDRFIPAWRLLLKLGLIAKKGDDD